MATDSKRQRIRVCLKSYEHKLVDVSAEKIVETANTGKIKKVLPVFFLMGSSQNRSMCKCDDSVKISTLDLTVLKIRTIT